MGFNSTTYVLSKKYTDETASEFGGLKGASCQIKSIEKQDGRNTVTFKWENSSGETRESVMYVDDGTPIYVWESGNTYHYGDLVIYASAFYRCIIENSDTDFDDTKWNEIGSPDGNYDIVQNSSLLPSRFTSADRKMYWSIEDKCFWLWNGNRWIAQVTVVQYTELPAAAALYENKIVQYIGTTTSTLTQGYFYKCEEITTNNYSWVNINIQNNNNDIICEEFDITSSYEVGDVVLYENELYKFKQTHAAGAWDSTEVDLKTIVQLINESEPASLTQQQKENLLALMQ